MKTSQHRRSSSKRRRSSSRSNRYKEQPLSIRTRSLPVHHRAAKWGIGVTMGIVALLSVIALISSAS